MSASLHRKPVRTGLYVHVPFCPQHCPYCGFAVVAGKRSLHERYVDAVCRELSCRGEEIQGLFATVYFGGGTPSRLEPRHLVRILETADSTCGIAADCEITMEANPGSEDSTRFGDFSKIGFNRISIGAQSFRDSSLKKLGRLHSADDAEAAFESARAAGFTSVNLDLIFAVPGVPRSDWLGTLDTVIRLSPDHVSTYSLTIEEGTRLEKQVASGRVRPQPEDEEAEQFSLGIEALSQAGYDQYEVSNFARPGHRCRHNSEYWSRGEYLGVGMSAHSHLKGVRSWNRADLHEYMGAVEGGDSPASGQESVDPSTGNRERLFLGLRTRDGVALSKGERLRLWNELKPLPLVTEGFLELGDSHLRLTPKGMPVADAVSVEIAELFERCARESA